jgi:hypothetical protein
MAASDTFEDETAVSDTFHPTDNVSEVIIDGAFNGTVKLQASRAGADVWADVLIAISQNNSFVQSYTLHTPDVAIDYRFSAIGVTGTANVYFGP